MDVEMNSEPWEPLEPREPREPRELCEALLRESEEF